MQEWRDKKVVIVGAARQGSALARYLACTGARVTLTDSRSQEDLQAVQAALVNLPAGCHPIQWVCGSHPLSLLDGTDLLCPSGGVPLSLPLIAEATARGIPLSNDSQIFLEAAPCCVVGITGSAGKTTTTTLVGRMAQAAVADRLAGYRQAWVGGNIGQPLISRLAEMQPDDLAIMELSSFQLEIMDRSPQVAAVLNITPNHLDRHGTMEAYQAAKAHILAYQGPEGKAILGQDDPGAWSLAGRVRGKLLSFGFNQPPDGQDGTYLAGQALMLRMKGAQFHLMDRDLILLRGEHNLLNVLAACAIAAAAGLPVTAMRAGVSAFRGVPHRLEFVRSWGGADWYNDSIATAPERAMAAIRSFDEPLVMLVGGRDKKLPWSDFARLAQQRLRKLIVFGEAAGLISQAVESAGASGLLIRCSNLHEAVQVAVQVVQPGDVVLLSPGGTSFDEFIDFEERGECFARWVKELPSETRTI